MTVDSEPGGGREGVSLSATTTTSQDTETQQQMYNEDNTIDPSISFMVVPANRIDNNNNNDEGTNSDDASTAAPMTNVVHAMLPKIQTSLLPGGTPLSPPLDQQHHLNLTTTIVSGTPLSSTSTASLAAVAERDEARAARLASLAENADINGLAQALDDAANATSSANSAIITDTGVAGTGGGLIGPTTALSFSPLNLTNIGAGMSGSGSGGSIAITTTSEPSHSIASHLLPTRLHSLETTLPPGSNLARQETPPDPRRALMKDQRAAAWRSLTIIERDALLVLSSMSKLAARDGGSGANTEDFTYKGKMLALELLVAVMTNPTHDWSHIRQEFALQLRQPLCLAVLKNCALTGSDVGVAAAGKIFSAMVLTPALRQGLKAEVGALYPLLLLKPLESWWEPGFSGTGGSSSQLPRSGSSGGLVGGGAAGNKGGKESVAAVQAALQCLLGVSQDPQTLVDIFVNYDCSLQSANLFERSVKVLARIVNATSSSLSMGSGIKKDERGMFLQKTSNMALQALLAIIESLDTWAGPIKSAAAASAASAAEIQDQEEKGEDSATLLSTQATAENITTIRGVSSSSEYNNNTNNRQQPLSPQTGALKPSPLPTRQLLGSAALQEIHAKKELKSSLAAGLDLFSTKPVKAIRHLIASKVISDPTPPGIAAFIRENINQLDKEALGELFGHHESEEIDIMHAYINAETYQGQLIDEALRGLLSGFRLPGEAQKIDRIMEKFAEKYCTDNPGSFPAADAAYLLAFAIIMLNTDAHNPMADRRINVDDFVTMCNYQTEGGEFAQILPTPDLEGICRRIVDKEIGLPGSDNNNNNSGGGTTGRVKQGGGGNSRAKLAAAVGLTQLVMPIWSGAAWDKQLAVRIERQRLETFTAQLLASGQGGGGGRWSAATHAEHARPMMQVAGQYILAALSAALSAASTLPEVLKVLASIEKAVKLASLLQLEDLTEKLMSALANAASVTNPAPQSTPQETKQVASLSRLVGLGSSMESGMLGASGWIVLLRTLSQLEKLKAKVIPTAEEIAASNVGDDGAGGSGFNRFLQKMGLGSSGTTAAAVGTAGGGGAPPSSSSSSQKLKFLSSGPLHILDVPGAGFALWAETAGANPIDACYSGSSSLDGDAVLSFMRALCAVSQEELTPPPHQGRPSVHMLQRAIECAHHNLGRIRLVWSRLWSIVSQHLVSAACHHDPNVAMYAVDALRQLTAKLLAPRRRAELTNFARQGEALRPFAAVLRHCDNPAVKDLAVSCVSQAVAARSAELGGPGWRSAIEALAVAAGDPAPEVVVRALGAMQLVFNVLYAEKNGHTCLTECAAAALEALGNDAQSEELALGAVDLFQILAGRLSYMQISLQQQGGGSGKMGGDGVVTARSLKIFKNLEDPSSTAPPPHSSSSSSSSSMTVEDKIAEAWGIILSPLAMTARQDPSARIADAAAAALFSILEGGAGGTTGSTSSSSSSSSSKQQQQQQQQKQNAAAIWKSIYFSAVVPLLQLPDDEAMKKWYRQQMGRMPVTSPRSNGTPGMRSTTTGSTNGTNNNEDDGGRLRGSLYKLHYQGRAAAHNHQHQHLHQSKELSWEGLIRLRRHAHTHFSQLWPIIHAGMLPHALQLVESYILFTGDLYHVHDMTRIMNMLPAPYHYTHHGSSNGGDDEYGSVPDIGIQQLHSYIKLLKMTSGENSSDGWKLVAASLKQHICPVNPLMRVSVSGGEEENREASSSSSIVGEVVMRQCQVSVQVQRLIYWAMSTSNSMSGKIVIPLQCQLDMLSALGVSVGVAMDGVNSDVGQQREMGVLLKQQLAASLQGGGGGGGLHHQHHSVWYDEEDEDDNDTATTTVQVHNRQQQQQQQQQPLKGPKALLYRQEIQGGLFLIKLLQQICSSTNSSKKQQQQSSELASFKVECEKRLSTICLKIITRAAQGIGGGGGTTNSSSSDVSENDAVRYPLVVGALEGCMSLSEEGWKGVQGEMFGSMARLVCCTSLEVRHALQRVMKERGSAALKMKI